MASPRRAPALSHPLSTSSHSRSPLILSLLSQFLFGSGPEVGVPNLGCTGLSTPRKVTPQAQVSGHRFIFSQSFPGNPDMQSHRWHPLQCDSPKPDLGGAHLPSSKMPSKYFTEQRTILSLRELLPAFLTKGCFLPPSHCSLEKCASAPHFTGEGQVCLV